MDTDIIREIVDQIRAQFSPDQFARDGMDELLSMYAVLALTKGANTTNQDVHNVWMIWARKYEPESPDIVPYDQLDRPSMSEDSPYTRAIHAAASTLK